MLLFFAGLAETLPINGAVLMTNTPVFVVVVGMSLAKRQSGDSAKGDGA